MNKELYHREIEFPKELRAHMKKSLSLIDNVDKNEEGFKRNQELQNQEKISYKQLKRIKNFFDNFKGNQKEKNFILNGGITMKNWVNNELRKLREYPKTTKKTKMDVGMQNQFIKPHEKKDFTNVRPSQQHKSTMEKYNSAVTESLKRINELISKI
jgi:hypothetical protein